MTRGCDPGACPHIITAVSPRWSVIALLTSALACGGASDGRPPQPAQTSAAQTQPTVTPPGGLEP